MPRELAPLRAPSERDRALRATLTELVVHLPCGSIRGPVHDRLWQSCRCEDEPVRWNTDVSAKHDLCVVCARGLAGGTSRWSWLGCGLCRALNKRMAASMPLSLPLGRHSIMNGAGARVTATGIERQADVARLLDTFLGWDVLHAWQQAEVRRLATSQGWQVDADVPLRIWRRRLPSSYERSADAISRLLATAEVSAPPVTLLALPEQRGEVRE